MEEKKEIRKKIFKARKEHTDAWIRENSLRITEALTQLPEYRNAERIMHMQIITMNDHTLYHRASLERRQGSGSAKGFRKGYGILQTDRFQSAGIRLLRDP